MNGFTSGSPPSPSLSPSLLNSYNMLTDVNKKLFNKVYRYLWGVVNSRRFVDRGGVLSSFWAVDLLRDRYKLNTSELSLLSFLYQITCRGAVVVHSDQVINSGALPHLLLISKNRLLVTLKHRGYISRSTRNPATPYYSRYTFRNPVYITLTRSGVEVVENIERDLYKILLHSSLDELTGNKKPH